MRHLRKLNKFNRTASHRRALLRNLSTSLVLHEQCETTLAKAKGLKRVIEKLITVAKSDTVASRRHAYDYLLDKAAVQKLFAEIGPRFKNRAGGYTRVIQTIFRVGDAAPRAIIALLTAEENKDGGSTKKKGAPRARKAKAAEAVESAA